MIVEIKNGMVHHVYPEYDTLESIRGRFASNIHMEEAPSNVREGWAFDLTKSGDSRFERPPVPEGWEYDPESGLPVPPATEDDRAHERKRRHAATTDDTMQALRKLREGDETRDWQAWLDALDAYNVAIEATKEQAEYPLKVVYPDYPVKPWEAD